MKTYLVSVIPGPLRPSLRRVYVFLRSGLDIATDFIGRIVDRLTGRERMVPPRSMIFVGDGEFEKVGREFAGYFIDLASLRPNDRVLDVGCGIGRMAIPLTSYLSTEGEYWGIDVVAKGVEWCQRRISPKFSNFHFLHSDVRNKNYNESGKIPACEYRFPFENGHFDFVLLTSVFTHMLLPDLENYLNEISRVLKTGRTCFVTFFLLNEESERLIRAGRSTLSFRYIIDACLTIDQDNPEAAIAYDEEMVKGLFQKYNLEIVEPIRYGSWCDREAYLSYQDIIVARKAAQTFGDADVSTTG